MQCQVLTKRDRREGKMDSNPQLHYISIHFSTWRQALNHTHNKKDVKPTITQNIPASSQHIHESRMATSQPLILITTWRQAILTHIYNNIHYHTFPYNSTIHAASDPTDIIHWLNGLGPNNRITLVHLIITHKASSRHNN